jgi:recombination protein RecA
MTKENLDEMMKEIADVDVLLRMKDVEDWFSTGCSQLDLSIANGRPGGVPLGRVIQWFGGAATSKSVLAMVIMGYALRSDKQVFYADVEYTLDAKFASMNGLDVSHEDFHYGYSFDVSTKTKPKTSQPESVEEFFDVYLRSILDLPDKRPKLVILDTLTALPSSVDLAAALDEKSFKTARPRAIGDGLRKYLAEMNEKDVTLVCIDQTRDNISGFGSAEITNGGRGMEFYSSVRIYLKHSSRVENSKGKVIGVWVQFEIAKNKVGAPFKKGWFKILFDYGIDNITSNLSWFASLFHDVKKVYQISLPVPFIMCPQCNALHGFPEDPKGALALLKAIDSSKKDRKKELTEQMIKEINSKCLEGHDLVYVSKRVMDWVPFIENHDQESNLEVIMADHWKLAHKSEDRKPREW